MVSPDQIALATALVHLLRALAAWPNWAVLMLLIVLALGSPMGVLVWFWRSDSSVMRAMLAAYREDTVNTDRRVEKYMAEMRSMYENNVELVRDRAADYDQLSKMMTDHHLTITKLTDALARLDASIRTNQFCPAARVEKRTVEVSR
jgi:hypothetical protein